MADPQLDSASLPKIASPTLPPRYLPAYPAMAERPMSRADISPTRAPTSVRKGESPPTLVIQSPSPARGLDCRSLVYVERLVRLDRSKPPAPPMPPAIAPPDAPPRPMDITNFCAAISATMRLKRS